MRVFVHVNCDVISGDFARHFAISVHRPSARFSALIDTAAIFGRGRVIRKFQHSHARTVVLPGPLHAFIASRGVRGNIASTSSCHASGTTPNTSRTNTRGSSRQRRMASVGLVATVAPGHHLL